MACFGGGALAVPSIAGAAVYAATDAGTVFESLNDGVAWSVKGQIAEPDVVSLSPGLTLGQLFALGKTGSLYRSLDAGATWTAVGNAGASACVGLAVARSGALLALTQSGDLARSSDGGATWAVTSSVGASDCAALAVGGKVGSLDTLFVVTSSGDVAMSPTGASWTNVGSTGYTPVVDLLWIRKTLYALTDAGEVLQSSSNGVGWSAIGTVSQVGMRDLAYVGGKFKAITREGEVYESTTGASWSASWIGTTNQLFTVAFAPGVPEFATGIDGPGNLPPGLALKAYPNPFTERVVLRLDDPSITAASAGLDPLEIFDTSGRLVARVSLNPAGSAGAFTAVWDGRLDDGRLAAAGRYFARARTAGSVGSEPVILLR